MTVRSERLLLRALSCPLCRDSGLLGVDDPGATELECDRCGARYPVEDGIPVLLPPPSLEEADGKQKTRQAAFFDESTSEEYEITRPHGTPAFHAWLLAEKFRRSIAGIAPVLPGCTALTVCGGSGMDAEYLARSGARVIASDISLGAAQRTRARARRFGVAIAPVVADAESLPFRTRSVDVVYVHDGLHHLEAPLSSLAEMARVADRAVSVTEPAAAGLTAAAVRLGLALAHEEAGNRVERLRIEDVAAALRSHGFSLVTAERYAMLYRHVPGRPMRLFSAAPLLPLAKAGFGALNIGLSRVGNKLTVQGIRPSALQAGDGRGGS